MKQCVRCNARKPADDFPLHKRTADGRGSWCRQCHRDYVAERYVSHPRPRLAEDERRQRAAVYAQEWRRRHPGHAIVYMREYNQRPEVRAKSKEARARRRKIEQASGPLVILLLLERDGNWCGVCHLPIDPACAYPHPDSLSIDHVVPLARGGTHTPDNVQLAHLHCNRRKGAREVAA